MSTGRTCVVRGRSGRGAAVRRRRPRPPRPRRGQRAGVEPRAAGLEAEAEAEHDAAEDDHDAGHPLPAPEHSGVSRWSRGTLSHNALRSHVCTGPTSSAATVRGVREAPEMREAPPPAEPGRLDRGWRHFLKASLTSFGGVLDLLAGVLDRGRGLVALALALEALVAGRLAGGLLGLALEVLGLVRGLVVQSHGGSFRRSCRSTLTTSAGAGGPPVQAKPQRRPELNDAALWRPCRHRPPAAAATAATTVTAAAAPDSGREPGLAGAPALTRRGRPEPPPRRERLRPPPPERAAGRDGRRQARPAGTYRRAPAPARPARAGRGSGGPGRATLVVVGVMPAARVRARTSRTCSSVIRVIDRAVGAGSRRTAGAVQVGLVLDRRVGVDDQRHVVDVDAAGGDVGGDEGARLAGVERVQVAGAGVLGEVAVQLDASGRRCC